MFSRRWTLFHFLLFVHLSGLIVINAQDDLEHRDCSESGKYTRDSPYRKSLDHALYSLNETNNGYGFYYYTSSQANSDSANAIALCRGDTLPGDCNRCVYDATQQLKIDCPFQKEATGWYEFCALRYSNNSILGTLDQSGVAFTSFFHEKVTDVKQFNQALSNLLDELRGKAAAQDSLRKYASGERNYTSGLENSTIYGIMQCTPEQLFS